MIIVFFNDKAPIVHCDYIYLGNHKSYTYCGKAYLDTCNNNDECSSLICDSSYGLCDIYSKGPSDGESVPSSSFYYIFYSFIIISLISIYYCCYGRNKKLNNKKILE